AVDLPGDAGERAVVGPAPRLDGGVRFGQPIRRSDVDCRRGNPRRRVGEDDLALGLEGPADLDAEVDVHRRSGPGRVVIDEDVVAMGPEAVVVAEEGPDLVEGRPPA